MDPKKLKAFKLTLITTEQGINMLAWNQRGDGSVTLTEDEAEALTLTLKGLYYLAKAELEPSND